ncbi:MAG: hypothetical protein JWN33_503 [Candidatus Saccharibacteria bacterium]|nr:hypothetical protein [Candidatus Saccharibacteria bacterium]
MADDNDNMNHLRRDVHEAHSESKLAKVLSWLALLGAVIALAMAGTAIGVANDAKNQSQRAIEQAQQAKAS